MGTIWVREFTGGLDTRRPPVATAGGVLIRAEDGHITRGGDVEQRAAFVPSYRLPARTVGLAHTPTGLAVFGHDSAPYGMPAGLVYQRLQHPNGVTALVRVLSYDLNAGKLYVAAEFADGSRHHFYDGVRVSDWYDGRARASFRVAQGGVGDALTNLTVNFVPVIGGPVAWASSHTQTAEAIAAAINDHTSSPDYTATAVGATVNVVADSSGDDANDWPVNFTVSGALEIDPATGLRLVGGADLTSSSFTPGTFVRTIGSKMYSVSGPNMHFSGIQQPTKWTTDNVGAGFVDMSSQSSGSEELLALAKYQNLLAVFSEYVIQIWFVDSDPANNKQSQVLNNTGTIAARSVTQFGDSDIFYLNESGLRSLRARDSSNAAATTDIGVPVDTILTDRIRAMNSTERQKITGLIEPRDGRFWLIIGPEIFVFSFFSGAKVSAWTMYNCVDQNGEAFEPTDTVVFQRRVYLRAGDTIYSFGGMSGAPVYDNTQVIAQLPFLDGNEPAREKTFEGVDVACEGEWEVYACLNPNDVTQAEKIATVTETTFNAQRIGLQGAATHISLLFKSKAHPEGGPARLSSALIHFAKTADED